MNRRELLLAAGAAGAGGPAEAKGPPADASIAGDLGHYDSLGTKQSGGTGDDATGAWLADRLEALDYRTHRQSFTVPFFDPGVATLQVGGQALPVWPQAPWRATPPAGVEGRLVRWPSASDPRGAIAVVTLRFNRWSAFQAREIEGPVRAALSAGAAGVVVVTTGPTGEVIALNVALEAAPFSAPVVLLAPKRAADVERLIDAGAPARLTVTGTAGERSAYNLVGRLDRGAGRWLVISTPRSGWFGCAGERGGGVAAWLALAAWARSATPPLDVMVVSASGHEREYAGAKLFLKAQAPPPERTAMWLHLGANVAARDWHDLGPKWTPLPSADPQRYLVATPQLLPAARRAFAGQPGLEAPYSSETLADGELGEILQAGYRRAAGVFGAHRFHHVATDDLRCVEPSLVQAAAGGFRTLLAQSLAL